MLLGPVFNVELTTTSRRARYFVLRAGYALLLLLFFGIVYQETMRYRGPVSIQTAAELAENIFVTFAWMQLTLVLLIGPALAAGTIASERERRTIEYLFATDLSNVEVVFAKLGARLVVTACLVLVGLPILALFRMMGGISGELLLVVFLITLSTMITLASTSVCISVWSPRAKDAVVRAYLILSVVIGLPLIAELLLRWTWGGLLDYRLARWVLAANDQLLAVNPIWQLIEVMNSTTGPIGARLELAPVWKMIAGQMVISAACIALATLQIRRVHLHASGKPDRKHIQKRFRLWRPELGRHPMLWKEIVARHSGVRLGILGRIAAAMIVLTVVGNAAWAFMQAGAWTKNWYGSQLQEYLELTVFVVVLAGCAGLLMVGARAAGSITGERERDCLASLASTPLLAHEIVMGKFWGNCYAARWLAMLLGILWIPGIAFDPGYFFAVIISFAVLGVLVAYASALGLLYSVHSRTTLRAMGATLGTMIVAGGAYLFCCIPAFATSSGSKEVFFAPCVPFLLLLPSIAYTSEHGHQHEPGLVVAFAFGTFGYFVAALVLIGAAINNFDRVVGRAEANAYNDNRAHRQNHGSIGDPFAPTAENSPCDPSAADEIPVVDVNLVDEKRKPPR